jgi:hypothetical protein
MIFDKLLITKYLKLNIIISHKGIYDHMRIVCTEQSARDFDKIVNDTVSYMQGRIRNWEEQYKDKIEEVGK